MRFEPSCPDFLPEIIGLADEFLKQCNPSHLLEFEQNVHKKFKQLADVIVEQALLKALDSPDFALQCIEEYHENGYRIHSREKPTAVQLLGGRTVSVQTVYMLPQQRKVEGSGRGVGQRGTQGKGIYPLLKKLGISNGASPALQNEVTLSALDNPFAQAADTLNRHGIEISEKRSRSISENVAQAAIAVRAEELEQFKAGQLPQGDEFAGHRVVVSIDGGRTRTRTPKRGRKKKGQKRTGFYTEWKEPKLFTIYAIDDNGKKLNRQINPINGGTFEGRNAFKVLLQTSLHKCGALSAKEITFVGDGAPWISNIIEEVIEEMKLDVTKVNNVLDFYHACEKVWEIIDSLPRLKQKEKKRLYKRIKRQFKKGKIESIIANLERKAEGKERIIEALSYFKERINKCRYDVFITKNIPIGSGAIESVVRRVVNLRLKGAGIFWLEENAEAFLHLRCQLKSGRWQEFFKTHLQSIAA